jgi:hypothetical protein
MWQGVACARVGVAGASALDTGMARIAVFTGMPLPGVTEFASSLGSAGFKILVVNGPSLADALSGEPSRRSRGDFKCCI